MQDVVKRKMESLEKKIETIENTIASLQNKKADKDKYIRELNNKISALKKEGQQIPSKVLERSEWFDRVDKIIVGGKKDLVAVYKLD